MPTPRCTVSARRLAEPVAAVVNNGATSMAGSFVQQYAQRSRRKLPPQYMCPPR